MKRCAWIPVLILMSCAALPAASVKDEVAGAEKAWATAVLGGDFATLDKLLAPDLIYTHSSGLLDNRTTYFARVKGGASKYDTLQEEPLTVNVHGNTAIVHCKVRMKGVADGQPFNVYGLMLHVWVKEGGRWKLAAHQATRLP